MLLQNINLLDLLQTHSLFQTMFPDSEIAKQFSCGKTKIMYLCVFGLAPYYEQKLLNILDNVPYYSISFDESLNKVTTNEQMDFHIRYWDTETQQVCSQYFASKFLGHAKANDLLQCFRDVTAKLKPQKILQISMDRQMSITNFTTIFLLKEKLQNLIFRVLLIWVHVVCM